MNFPLELRFRLLAIASQLWLRDANGGLLCYAKQKLFRLKEDVIVFGDEEQTRPLYRIQADRVIDFSAQYHVSEAATGRRIGSVKRRGMRSLWRAQYEIERDGTTVFTVREESVWTRVADGLFGQLPVLGIFAGYLFHPAYRVSEVGSDRAVMRVVKQPALFEGRFRFEELALQPEEDQRLAVLCMVMVLLLERTRG